VVSALGLAARKCRNFTGRATIKKSITAIRRALELRIYSLDNADICGIGDNEELVGKAIRGVRDKVFLATKYG
jgi:aryl-alcohol dehydrogenase-like predicted oxidoreductase